MHGVVVRYRWNKGREEGGDAALGNCSVFFFRGAAWGRSG
jgi:hypothetical protein